MMLMNLRKTYNKNNNAKDNNIFKPNSGLKFFTDTKQEAQLLLRNSQSYLLIQFLCFLVLMHDFHTIIMRNSFWVL